MSDNLPTIDPKVYQFCIDNDLVLTNEQGIALTKLMAAERLDELNQVGASFVRTGYAGDHHTYQTGFDVAKRRAQLTHQTQADGEDEG